MNEDLINLKVEDLVKNFEHYIAHFKKNNPFSGPSEYFYMNKIIKTIRTKDNEKIFSTEFIELIYATLASWGMHRMGPDNKGAKMNDFDSFKGCILQNKDNFIRLSNVRIKEVKLDEGMMEDLDNMYSSLGPLMSVMQNHIS